MAEPLELPSHYADFDHAEPTRHALDDGVRDELRTLAAVVRSEIADDSDEEHTAPIDDRDERITDLEKQLAAMTLSRDGNMASADRYAAQIDDLKVALGVAERAMEALHAQFEGLKTSTIWDVEWQGGRAWVAAPTIESAIVKVRATDPTIAVRVIKASNITLVI